MLGARVRRIRESNDPTDDVGLIVNPAGHHLLSQRGREIVLGEGEAALVSLFVFLSATYACALVTNLSR